jgi:L-asparaginase
MNFRRSLPEIRCQSCLSPVCSRQRAMLAEDATMQPIRILVTGGTFDKEYNELTGELFFQSTHTGDMLGLGRCLLEVEIETLMMIDSLQMTDAGRRQILERCRAVPEIRIVITHGTDTMVETAAVLGPALRGKTVVLTGAMVPYTFGSSDGLFNLGTAMAFVQTLGEGVYVAMNGRCWAWHAVRKDKKRGIFESVAGLRDT